MEFPDPAPSRALMRTVGEEGENAQGLRCGGIGEKQARTTMALFLGIDGGCSHTRALLCDADGRGLGAGTGGISNYHHAGWEEAAHAMADAVQAARAAAGIGDGICDGVFLGMAGVSTEEARTHWRTIVVQLELVARETKVGVDHDLDIALAGGLAGRPGIVVVAGTGSAAYGRDAAGNTWKAGGWGSLLDDGGGGYWLGAQALAAAARAEDGRGISTTLGPRALARLELPSVREAMTRMIAGTLRRHEVARVAADVIAAAAEGDAVADKLLERGAGELALMAGAVARKIFAGGAPAVVLAGTTAQQPGYAERIVRALAAEMPAAQVVPAALPPVAGAVLRALQEAGRPVDATVVARLGAAVR
jgi:glucosamine kinase